MCVCVYAFTYSYKELYALIRLIKCVRFVFFLADFEPDILNVCLSVFCV